jgi:DNA-binding CsgD family transcriptional regulator/PAS domain-containing protein
VYSAEQLGSLVESVYDASIDGARWPAFLSMLAQQLSGVLPTLFIHDTRAHSGALAINVGYDSGIVRAYKAHFAERNIWLRSGHHLLTPGSVRTSHIMCSRQALLASEWYADYCRPLNISQGIGATIHKDSMLTSNVAIFAGDDRADFGGEEIALLKALMPHMQRALKIHMHLAEANLRQGEFVEAIEPLAVGVILVTASGQVLFANRSARRLLDNRDGLMIDRQGLRAGRSRETNALRALIGCTMGPYGQGRSQSGGGLNVTRPNGRRALQVLVSPIRPQQSLHLGARAVAAIYVTDPEQVSERPEVVLMRLYGLTPAEAKVAALIVRGMSARQAAEGLAISYNTVKSHLKRVFAKTGTNGQGDLIRLIVGRAAQTGSVSGKQ